MAEVEYTAAQSGTNEVGGSSEWDESLLKVDSGFYGGLRFSVTGEILPLSASLTLIADATFTPADDLRVFYATAGSPSAWSSSNQPVSANRVQVGIFRTRGSLVTAGDEIAITLKLSWISRNVCQPKEGTAYNGFLNFVLESSDQFLLRDLTDTGFEPALTIDSNATSNSERFSVAGRRHHERWAISPRSGQPHPIGEFVRDGEQRNLYVPADERDQIGRRDARAHGRSEREPRMWPRI